MLTRRTVLKSAAAFTPGTAAPGPLRRLLSSPDFLVNGIATDAAGTRFVSMPRWAGMDDTPGLGRVAADGSIEPFPGGAWHDWRHGPPADRLLQVNAVHVFDDGLVWVVDQGAPDRTNVLPGGQKLLAFEPDGTLAHRIRFDDRILPKGAAMNDLRKHGPRIYVTDSGLGGIVLHDLQTGTTLRRLSRHPALRARADHVQRGTAGRVLQDAEGKRPQVHSDVIELSADGAWLDWAPPAGPLRRIRTDALWDASLDDAALARGIEFVAEIPSIGGSAIDDLGNIYLSDAEARRIAVLLPSGETVTLVQDDRLVSPDALWIDGARRLLVPAPQTELLPENAGGEDRRRPPFEVFFLELPLSVGGRPLGHAVSGRAQRLSKSHTASKPMRSQNALKSYMPMPGV